MSRKLSDNDGIRQVAQWMLSKGRTPFPFQRRTWREMAAGRGGLLHSPTGTGKTLAIWLGAVAEWFQRHGPPQSHCREQVSRTSRLRHEPIQLIWLTPLRALASDTLDALREPITDLNLPWSVEKRTSDTSSQLKTKQIQRLPSALITTPESLSVLLSQPAVPDQLAGLRWIVLDEWHELLSTKRGVLTELCLSRLRTLSPDIQTWAVSATIGNIEQAMNTALGIEDHHRESVLIQAPQRRKTLLSSLIPENVERFPWSGHMGLNALPAVVREIESAGSTLVFTNTRSQAERWYSAILHEKKEWAGKIGIHHGSLERKKRTWVEQQLDAGNLKCVVCTSSLDLGVDFFPVEKVLQIGSPKGIARLMQRAGRSGHYPGGKSQLVFVPTHALELVELAAARDAVREKRIESRLPIRQALDVLVQHLVTIATGTAIDPTVVFNEVRRTHAFQDLLEEEWNWVLEFVTQGGSSLRAYPEFQRLVESKGRLRIRDAKLARHHRTSIGTIPSDREMQVQYLKGGRLGTIEERFISRLKPGDKFLFAGRTLKLVMVRDMTVWVRKATGKVAALPRWHGGRLPLSSELAESVRIKLDEARNGIFRGPEMRAIKPLLELQATWSEIPDRDSLLVEQVKTRDGHHTFIYPFEGTLVHEGLAAIFAWRLSRLQPITFSTTINDYGIELLSSTPPPLDEAFQLGLFSSSGLEHQIEHSMNAGEMDRRQFRDIARIAGLVHGGMPGYGKSSKQLQASSDLFFDVFREYDPGNLLLKQARREVLDFQLERERLEDALDRIASCKILLRRPPKPTPLAFPILVDRLKMKLSSEKLLDRITRLTQQFEAAATRKDATLA